MYFETFYYISNYGTSKNMEFDIELAKCKQQQQQADEIEKLKDSRKVDLYQFILHLYIQQFYSIDLKSSFMSREECVCVFSTLPFLYSGIIYFLSCLF